MFYSLELIVIPFTTSWEVCLGVFLPKPSIYALFSLMLKVLKRLLMKGLPKTPFDDQEANYALFLSPASSPKTPFAFGEKLFTPFAEELTKNAF